MVSVLLLSRSVVLFLCFMRIASEGSGEENFGTNGSTTTTDFQDGTSSTSSRVEWTSSGVESASLSSSPLRSTADTTPSTSASSTAASTSTILTTTESGRIRCRDISRMEIEAFYEPNDDFCAYFIPISIIEGGEGLLTTVNLLMCAEVAAVGKGLRTRGAFERLFAG
ncbi:hypothetical protein L596_008495 [Steinernema carpocapsae]|uniref:Uncharacterized protein n=1 Tax=Steinernema carpocapsae TaxID=34508 RepID=A0A4U5PCR6_STECR|nr:hypothetical protein L596_008495 [Steinernema carpocapsae]